MNKNKPKIKPVVPAKKNHLPIPQKKKIDIHLILAALLFFLLPVIYDEKAVDQVLVLRFLFLSGILLLYFLLAFFNRKEKILRIEILQLPVFLCWLLFLIVSVFSLVNAINPVEGLFDISRTALLFLLLLVLVNEISMNKGLESFVVFVSLANLVYLLTGYIQYFRFAFGHDDLQALYKVIGIWTHKNFFSSMLFLQFPVMLYGLNFQKKYRKALAVLIFFNLNLIFLLQTRSVWLSVLSFAFVMAFFMLVFRNKLKNGEEALKFRGNIRLAGIILVLSVLSAWGLTSISVHQKLDSRAAEKKISRSDDGVNQEKSIKNIDERAATMFDVREANTRHRIEMWKMSFRMIKKHPLLGIGAGNWKIAVADYLPEDYNKNYFNNIRRPHNDLLWIFSEKGIFALLAYVAFFVFLILFAFRIIKKESDFRKKIIAIIAISAIAGYFADSMLSFPYERMEHQVMLMFYCALIISIYLNCCPLFLKKDGWLMKNSKSVHLTALFILILTTWLGKTWLQDERNIKKAISGIMSGRWNLTEENAEKAVHPLAQLDARNVPSAWYCGKAWEMMGDQQKALEYLELAYKQNPNFILALIDLGSVYGKTGRTDDAVELFKKAIRIYPGSRDGWQNLGAAYYQNKQYEEALKCFEKLNELKYDPEVVKIIDMIKNTHLKK